MPRASWAVAAAAAALFVLLSVVQTSVWRGSVEVSDVPHYEVLGALVEAGGVPYRDFRFEYPPGALPALAAPALLTHSSRGYARAFGAGMVVYGIALILLTAACLAVLAAGTVRTAAALAVPAFSPLLLGPLLLTRFDLFPTVLAVGALAALLNGRDRLGAVVLGLGIAVKLWPGLLLPLFVAWSWRRRGRRQAQVVLVLAVATAAAVFALPVLLAPGPVADSLWRQLSRPLQIESVGAAALLALHHAASLPLGWASSHGSQNLTGAVAVIAAAVTSVAQVTVLGWLWVRFARGPADPERLVRYAAAVVVAFVALGKVLSPQFLVWLLPLVPLVAGWRGLAAGGLLVAACLLTRGWFPDHYWELVREFDETSSWLLLARDVTLLGLLAVLAWPSGGVLNVNVAGGRESGRFQGSSRVADPRERIRGLRW
jgi:hypothetical protein